MIDSIKHQLQVTGATLVLFLESQLSGIGGENWWQTHVLQQLTYAQQGQVRLRGISRLGGLDLAALLRVFERNWAELSYTASLPNEVRTHLRELADLRNAMAHHAADGSGIAPADAFRHFDTIIRVLKELKADPSVLNTAEAARNDALRRLAADFTPPPEIVHVPVEVVREVIREVAASPPAAPSPIPHGFENAAVHEIGAFRLIGPGELPPSKVASFDGEEIEATAVPWRVEGPGGLEFVIHVVLIDEPGNSKEFGQVFCESRLASLDKWDDIVRRVRIGIRQLDDGELIMDLRCAVRPGGGRATRNVKTLAELDKITGLNVASTLKSIGATAIGTREEIASETNRNRNVPAVSFAIDDLVTPAAAWVLATLQCLI
jgi:hypothetical protein